MSVAYLIRAHHRPVQLARLIDRLTAAGASVFLHISARTSVETYADMRRELEHRDDVHWLPRVATYYAGFSLVEATLTGLREIARSDPMPAHTVILSGQDYPLRPAAEIERTLAERAGESLVEHFPIPTERWSAENGGLDRIRYWHFERLHYRTRILRVPLVRRRFPAGLEPYGGSAWCALSAEAVRTVVGFAEQNPRAFRFFKHVKIPDEIFVQTVLLNSQLRDRVVNESTHYLEWPGGSHPETFGREDFTRLAESGKLFARKFDVKHDAEILDLIDRELLARRSEPAAKSS